jgi:CHAD domain-containing protein
MSYRIKKGEGLPAAFGRIAAEELDAATAGLDGHPRGEAVHITRKSLKRLRALLRAFREACDSESFGRENKRLSDAGRKISPLRDVHVQLGALGHLRGGSNTVRRLRRDLQHLEKMLEQKVPALQNDVRKTLQDSRLALRDWPSTKMTPEAVATSVKHIYKQGRRAGKKAKRSEAAPKLHGWRKKVKLLGYSLKLMKDLLPKKQARLIRCCKKLEAALGNDHDLFMLLHTLRHADGTHARDNSGLMDRISAQRARLKKRAFKLREKVFDTQPRNFKKRLLKALIHCGLGQ